MASKNLNVKKILKAITFLSLAMCLMLNTNVVYAEKHPKCKRTDVFDSVHNSDPYRKGLLYIITQYVPHDELVTLAENANNRQKAEKKAQITLISGLGMAAGGIAGFAVGQAPGAAIGTTAGGSIAGGLAAIVTSSIQNEGEKWLEASIRNSYCGVKMHYWVNPITKTWEYGGFEAQ